MKVGYFIEGKVQIEDHKMKTLEKRVSNKKV